MSVENRNSRCIWLVDDDEEDLMLMRTAFRNVAPEVEIKTLLDGEDLLPELQSRLPLPNLVLIDLNMVCISGFEAIGRVRALNQFDQLPIVVLTTSTSQEDRRQSVALGANDFFSKPSSFTDLTSLARELTHQWLPEMSC